MYPLVRELAADGIPVTVSCRVLELARQPYYRWLESPFTDAQLDEAYLANAIFDAHVDDPEFGYRFLADEVRHIAEFSDVSDRVVWRICRDHQWWSVFGKKKPSKTSKPGAPSHDDLVEARLHRRGTQPALAQRLDRASHRRRQALPVRDQRRVLEPDRRLGHLERMKARLVVAAIEMAVARRGDVAGCILHSDRGSQFRARKVHRALARHGMVGSMGHVGAAGDNAAMESFFSLLQKNVLDRRTWTTRDELRIEIVTWIERTYHHRRRQTRLGRLTPIEYETIMTPPAAPAA